MLFDARLATAAILMLVGCHQPQSTGQADEPSIRRLASQTIGKTCEAQSECSNGERCAYRGEKLPKSLKGVRQPPLVEHGICERALWPGGCFGLLPTTKPTVTDKIDAREQRHPISIVCE